MLEWTLILWTRWIYTTIRNVILVITVVVLGNLYLYRQTHSLMQNNFGHWKFNDPGCFEYYWMKK